MHRAGSTEPIKLVAYPAEHHLSPLGQFEHHLDRTALTDLGHPLGDRGRQITLILKLERDLAQWDGRLARRGRRLGLRA